MGLLLKTRLAIATHEVIWEVLMSLKEGLQGFSMTIHNGMSSVDEALTMGKFFLLSGLCHLRVFLSLLWASVATPS